MRLPFPYDFAAYTRFLIAMPLLILAEGLIERRVSEVVTHFVDAGLVPESNLPAYQAVLHRGRRLRDSTLAEVLLVGLAAVSIVLIRDEFPFDFSTWRSVVSDSVDARTLAGWWYLVVGGSVSVSVLAMDLGTFYLVRVSLARIEAQSEIDPDPPRRGGRLGFRGRNPTLLLEHRLCLFGHDGWRPGQRNRLWRRFSQAL